MKIFKVCVSADDSINGTDVGSVTLEGVRCFTKEAAYDFGAEVAGELYGWNGPGMVIVVVQTGEESRR